jgi:hypothetical protein
MTRDPILRELELKGDGNGAARRCAADGGALSAKLRCGEMVMVLKRDFGPDAASRRPVATAV